MKRTKLCPVFAFVLLAMGEVGCGQAKKASSAPELPTLPPPFRAARTGRETPLFRTVSSLKAGQACERPTYTAGNKLVAIRAGNDNNLHLSVSGRELMSIAFWGAIPKLGFGYPFAELPGKPSSFAFDAATGRTTFTRPYLSATNHPAVFSYTLKPVGPGRLALSWDSGSEVPVSPWFMFPTPYRRHRLTIGGVPVAKADREALMQKARNGRRYSGTLVYDADRPAEFFTCELGNTAGYTEETIDLPHIAGTEEERYSLTFRLENSTRGSIVIDLGESELRSEGTPPPVGNIDFWGEDATEVPLRPTRNLMPNPSFEQGMRYWIWTGGGASYIATNTPRYEAVAGGRFGRSALLIRGFPSEPGLISFPIPLESGKPYTLSFYLKAAPGAAHGNFSAGLASAAAGGKIGNTLWGDTSKKEAHFVATPGWTRHERHFTADGGGFRLYVDGWDALVDGIQLEPGTQATPFACAPIEADFVTARPDNDLSAGEPFASALACTGAPGTSGTVAIEIQNGYRETVYTNTLPVTIGPDGTARVPLALPEKRLGLGLFRVRTLTTVPGTPPYAEFYRFSVMRKLANRHPTASLFGPADMSHGLRISTGRQTAARKFVDWGFGCVTWFRTSRDSARYYGLFREYGVTNWQTTIGDELWAACSTNPASPFVTRGPGISAYSFAYRQPAVTPAMVAFTEKVTDALCARLPHDIFPYLSFSNEEEGGLSELKTPFDDYARLQTAVGRVARRHGFKCTPTSGTSGYNLLRGFDAYEGYLAAAGRAGFKYDALSIHPYGSIDKGALSSSDLDEELQRLIDQGRRHGYGDETPILCTEGFNIPETFVPEWNAGPDYDSYQAGKPTYDFGHRELLQAFSAMRLYLICLKYWPRVRCFNCWVWHPYLDLRLTPILLAACVNTLGNEFGDVSFAGDVRPAAGIRGYCFRHLPDGSGVAALWSTLPDVDNGYRSSPVLSVKFTQPVTFLDAMGNPRSACRSPEGYVSIPVTPAPLILKAADPARLLSDLRTACSGSAADSIAVAFGPRPDGSAAALLQNQTDRRQHGRLEVADQSIPYDLKPRASATLPIRLPGDSSDPARPHIWNHAYALRPAAGGEPATGVWRMESLRVLPTAGRRWKSVPALSLTNRCPPSADVPAATVQLAYDGDALGLRILLASGGTLRPDTFEVSIDVGADGRRHPALGLDDNDYVYSITRGPQTGTCSLRRLRCVDKQLAQGLNTPTPEEAAAKIPCSWRKTGDGREEILLSLPARYLAPLALRPGTLAGLGLDFRAGGEVILSDSAEPGQPCSGHPERWPLILL